MTKAALAPLLLTAADAVKFQFLAQKAGNTTANVGVESAHRAKYSVKYHQEKCNEACGDDVDVSCYTECETAMYECYDTNTPPGGDKVDKCEEDVVATFEKFEENWLAMMFLLNKEAAKDDGKCGQVCGVDSQCKTACEVEMHTCVDANTPNSEDIIPKCQEEVSAKYAETVAFFAAHNDVKKRGEELCGGCGVDSMCRAACETAMYECYDKNTPNSEDKIEECQDKVAEEHKSQIKFFAALKTTVEQRKKGKHVVSQRVWKKVQGDCDEACGPDPESHCVTKCETAVVACHDDNTPNSEDKIEGCTKAVLEEASGKEEVAKGNETANETKAE